MEYYYGTTLTPYAKGRRFRNPSWFLTTENDASKVIVVGHWPKIVDAYLDKGVPVVSLTLDAANRVRDFPERVPQNVKSAPVEDPKIFRPESIQLPDDWRLLAWNDLRRFASAVSEHRVINKAQAIEVLEAYVNHRKDGEV